MAFPFKCFGDTILFDLDCQSQLLAPLSSPISPGLHLFFLLISASYQFVLFDLCRALSRGMTQSSPVSEPTSPPPIMFSFPPTLPLPLL